MVVSVSVHHYIMQASSSEYVLRILDTRMSITRSNLHRFPVKSLKNLKILILHLKSCILN